MTDEELENRDISMLKRHVAQLCEHFDSVEIFANRQHDSGTVTVCYGEGNWFARYGQVKAWVISEDAAFAKKAIELGDD